MGLFGLFNRKPLPEQAPAPQGKIVKTFSFALADIKKPSKYPAFYGADRESAVTITKVGEPCYLKPYEWEGKTSLVVMNSKRNNDMGTVPQRLVKDVLELMDQYDVSLSITNKDAFDKELDYNGVEMRIVCREKMA